ncbi:MAG: hypothetical protein WCG27_06015, partial [Pseudomonadota bacterium]
MKKINLILMSLMLLVFISCGGGGGGGDSSPSKVNSFVGLLNSRYAGPGTIYAVKGPDKTLTADFVVVYVPSTGEYVSYDIKNYYIGMGWSNYASSAEYQEVYINRTEFDPIRGETLYYGDAYQNNTWGTYAGEFVFEEMK